jgi:hypothetical protein
LAAGGWHVKLTPHQFAASSDASRWSTVTQEKAMRIVLGAIAMSAALVATEASAQGVNLTGPYQCIQGCVTVRPGDFAFVTQNGWELNMVNEAGQASRAWVDYPGRIWIARANLGAIYSSDGMVIQFDNGTIWKRAPEPPPAPPPRRRRR